MSQAETLCHDLSDRLALLRNTFRKAKEGYLEFDAQSSKTFLAMLDESYEDALLLEGAVFVRSLQGDGGARPASASTSADVIAFPRTFRATEVSGDDERG